MDSNKPCYVSFCILKAYNVIVNWQKNIFDIYEATVGNRQNMIIFFLILFPKSHFFSSKFGMIRVFTIFFMDSNAPCYVSFCILKAYNVIVNCRKNIFYIHEGTVGNRQNMISF